MANSNDDAPSMKPGPDAQNQASPEEFSERGRGRRARKPTEVPGPGWMDIFKRTGQQVGEDNLSIVAAGVAFYCFMAMVPALAALIAIYALVAEPSAVTGHIESMAAVLPEQARPLLHDQLTRLTSDNEAAGWSALLGIGIALFGAMKAVNALITGLNIAYDEVEKRGIVKLYATAFLLTFAGIVGALIVITVVAVIPSVLRMIGGGATAEAIFNIARWPVLAGLFMAALAVVYPYAACRKKARWRWVSWGAGAATGLWLLGSAAFSLYVSSFGNYEGTYGSLGAVVVFLMWLYLSSYVILIGAELDAEMERQTLKDTTAGPDKPMGERGAYAADTLGEAKGKK